MGKSFVYNRGTAADDIKADEIRLEFGVFIDGTLNNKDNTDLRVKYAGKTEQGLTPEEKEERKKYLVASHRSVFDKMGTDNSFSNDYTNVARKWKCCKKEYRIYVPGMGTSDVVTQGIKSDDDDGFQYGAGDLSGIRARVRLGCESLAEKIEQEVANKNSKDLKSIEVQVDVFGFSRGAASARNFVYEITKDEYSPLEMEVSYYESQVVPTKHTFTKLDRLIITPKHTIKVKKKKKVPIADSDGQKTDTSLYVDGKLPQMGHLGYSLLKLGMLKKNLEKVTVSVRFLGIYDTVSSYEEWGPMGGDSTIKKSIRHLRKSLFKDDVEQLNLNTLRCTKIVHFTAKDEHRENFDLTRIPNANIKSEMGTYRRIEKNFPGVHCDIGGAYLTGEEIIDEIEVVDKPDLTGLRTFQNSKETPTMLLKDFSKKLISEYWYKDYELEIHEEWAPTRFNYHKLTGTRKKIHKEYSFIPLHFMKDYCDEYMKKNMIEGKIETDYPLDTKLIAAKNHLKPYVMNQGGKEWNFISDEVFIRKQNIEKVAADKKEKERQEKLKNSIIISEMATLKKGDLIIKKDNLRVVKPKFDVIIKPKLTADQILLRELRNKYFHWSANRDWAGMDPAKDRKRDEH